VSLARKPSAATAPALTITSDNCKPLTGFDRRPWLRALVQLRVPHCRIGRRTVCTASDWLAAIDRATGKTWNRADVIAAANRKGGGP
jgi:hypothetical protein